MPPSFMVSAPGKVILFGEHAVLYGKPAIATAISLRSYLFVTILPRSHRTVTLKFPDIGLQHEWNIDDLPWHVAHQAAKKAFHQSRVTSLEPELFDAIAPYAAAVSKGRSENERQNHVRSATAFLYLFLCLGSPDSAGFIYTLRSIIPIGAGLGSSAGVCVCLSAALLLQTGAITNPDSDQPPAEAEAQLARINCWAFVGEMCTHGLPSGVDNTVSVGGKAVLYQNNSVGPPSVTPLTSFPKLRFLLINTQQPRSTTSQVKMVKALKETYPTMIESILNTIGQLTTCALDFLSAPDLSRCNTADVLERLGNLIRMNHGLLVSLGVSHPRLERIRNLVDYADIGWTKLTGAGGGGCAITLFRPDVDEAIVRKLERDLTSEGFQTYDTVLGGAGVGVLWPAAFKGVDGDREGVDPAKFERAIDAPDLEKLVGVGMQEDRGGWRFWTSAV